ncbi:MAG: hypothetical protein ACREON_01410 [Gemmatimonadaceae bacterium]
MTCTRPGAPLWRALLLCCALLAGCGGGAEIGGMSRASFVTVMSELHALATTSELDSAARTTARDSVLRKFEVSPDELERAARSLAATPERAAEVWGEIERRSEDIRSGGKQEADTTAGTQTK